mmetsp:Transcript_24697/g.30370  ORF Transcript_24697/g.30370 Transcript_24697/m.30370 type:complete len:100 (+) Transcript_24697:119-418(+)
MLGPVFKSPTFNMENARPVLLILLLELENMIPMVAACVLPDMPLLRLFEGRRRVDRFWLDMAMSEAVVWNVKLAKMSTISTLEVWRLTILILVKGSIVE